MARFPITDQDRRILRDMWNADFTKVQIAKKLKRTRATVQHMADQMGLKPKPLSPSNSVWTSEIIEFLRVEWLAGASATDVATALNNKFGTAFTRNATIGKVHREGFFRPEDVSYQNKRQNGVNNLRAANQKPQKTAKTRQKPQKTAIPNPKASYGADDNIREAWVIVTDAAWDILPGSEPKTLLNRRNFGECKYPVGIDEPEQRFCCARTAQTYCEAHRRIMYRPPTKGERDTLRPRHIMRAASR